MNESEINRIPTKRPVVPFPQHYFWLNSGLIFVIIDFNLYSNSSDRDFNSIGYIFGFLVYLLLFGGVTTAIASALSLLYHLVVYFLARKRLRIRQIWLFLFILPALSIACLEIYSNRQSAKIESILSAGRLADLPPDASDIHYDSWSAMFTGEQFLRFTASEQTIEQFIKNSKSLNSIEPAIISVEYPRLPWTDSVDLERISSKEFKNSYHERPTIPDWYMGPHRARGRYFEIPNHEGHNWGEIIIDDETHTVYINVVWS